MQLPPVLVSSSGMHSSGSAHQDNSLAKTMFVRLANSGTLSILVCSMLIRHTCMFQGHWIVFKHSNQSVHHSMCTHSLLAVLM